MKEFGIGLLAIVVVSSFIYTWNYFWQYKEAQLFMAPLVVLTVSFGLIWLIGLIVYEVYKIITD